VRRLAERGITSIEVTLDTVYKTESRRILATLVRVLGDIDLAEDALQDAFAAAARQWPNTGVPDNPAAWLITAARFRGIDTLRRRSRLSSKLPALVAGEQERGDPAETALETVPDDQLRLIFLCCHPDLPADARPALTLREVCGLTTEEIARAFLTRPATIAQRIVRAKARIRDAKIAYTVPDRKELPARLEAVLQVIYLVFSEGYSATAGDALTRSDLTTEAIRLGRLLVELLPEPEASGLLGLMLLQESRRSARTTAGGDIVLLEDQDRSLWDTGLIEEGVAAVNRAMSSGVVGFYTIQAAIAAEHATAVVSDATRWGRIVDLYDLLLSVGPSPVVELNRAVAVAMRDGPGAGLEIVESLLSRGELTTFHLAYTAQGEFARRLGRVELARESYRKAIALVRQEPERRLLERRLIALG